MSDDEGLDEEEKRLLRSMNAARNKRPGLLPTVIPTKPQEKPVKAPAPTKPQEKPVTTASLSTSVATSKLDELNRKKSNILGSINTGKREIESVQQKIGQLQQELEKLQELQEKRNHALQEIQHQIEQEVEAKDKSQEENARREQDEERRRKEEFDRWNKEREEKLEEERKKREESSSWSHGGRTTSSDNFDIVPEKQVMVSATPTNAEEDLEAEEARLMRAMTRQKGGGGGTFVPKKSVEPVPTQTKQQVPPQRDHKYLEAEQKREEERKRRVQEIELQKHREEEEKQKAAQRARQEEEERNNILNSLLSKTEGRKVTFSSPPIYDFGVQVFLAGTFTEWKEIPMKNTNDPFVYQIELPLSKGTHFYRYKIDGKWEVSKKEPTGVGPQGDLCNKIQID